MAGADAAGWKKVKRCPRFLVLDTGTTCTYAAPDLGQRMREAGGWKNEMSSSLRLVLDGGAVLTYTPKELKDPDDKTRSVFNCEPHTTLEDFSDIFSGIDAILFGAVMMRNMYWEYDLDKARVGMCKIIN